MAVDRARGEDLAVAGEDLGRRADDERGIDAVHRVGIAGLADTDDPAVAHADVRLDDAPVVEHDRAGDHEIGRALPLGSRATAPSTRARPCRRRRRSRRRPRSGPPRPRSTGRCRPTGRDRHASARTAARNGAARSHALRPASPGFPVDPSAVRLRPRLVERPADLAAESGDDARRGTARGRRRARCPARTGCSCPRGCRAANPRAAVVERERGFVSAK